MTLNVFCLLMPAWLLTDTGSDSIMRNMKTSGLKALNTVIWHLKVKTVITVLSEQLNLRISEALRSAGNWLIKSGGCISVEVSLNFSPKCL